MLLIITFFALLAASITRFRSETQVIKREEQKEIVPEISVEEKKAQFKATIVPAVDEVYDELMQRYENILKLIETEGDNDKLKALRKQYKVRDNAELLTALKPHPKSITLAQAAIESSWATSRFFKEANNTFGVWSFSKNEPRIPANEKRGDKTIWIKKYASVKDSIRDYYRNLARGPAYEEFRKLKMETDDPYQLIKKLDHYSEKGAKYSEELATIIRHNNFENYDRQHIKL